MIKLPRTFHLEDSRKLNGEIDPDSIKLSTLTNKFVIVEEKVDGTSVGLSFDDNANITIQTRGKVANAKQFTRLHTWAHDHMNEFWELLGDRYIMFGEWMYAKHTAFYDNLCHYFLESDVYDRKNDQWLSTNKRQELISKYTFIHSVPIIKIGRIHSREELKSLIMPSFYKTSKWKQNLKFYCDKYHYDFDKILSQTDDSSLSEGLYIKHEDTEQILGRYKYIRFQFLDTMLKSGSHWIDRAIIPNITIDHNQW